MAIEPTTMTSARTPTHRGCAATPAYVDRGDVSTPMTRIGRLFDSAAIGSGAAIVFDTGKPLWQLRFYVYTFRLEAVFTAAHLCHSRTRDPFFRRPFCGGAVVNTFFSTPSPA